MNNRRDRLSADMKGTVAIEGGQKDLQKEKETLNKGEQNDRPADGLETPSEMNTNPDEEENRNSQSNDNTEASQRSVTVGDQERLQLDWRVSQWSRCSRTCGKDGKKVHVLQQ